MNVPRKLESTVKATDLVSRDFKEVKVKLELPKSIQTLDLKDSLSSLEVTNMKNKNAIAEQILRFHSQRTVENRESEFEDDDDLSDEENGFSDSDTDLHVNVYSAA